MNILNRVKETPEETAARQKETPKKNRGTWGKINDAIKEAIADDAAQGNKEKKPADQS